MKKDNQNINHGSAVISKHVKSYESDPYFIRKTEKALDLLKKFGLPDFKKK